MKVYYSQEARDQIRSLAPEIKKGIRRSLELLFENPCLGKPLLRELKGFWSLAFKRYRILYRFKKPASEIQVYSIGHREDVYENLAKSLARRH